MKNINLERRNTLFLILSNSISKAGDLMFDFANKSFLASINLNSLYLVGIYQFLESIIGTIFNLFGGAIADRFKRKKIIILTDFFSGLACIFLSFIKVDIWLLYGIIFTNVLLAILSSFLSPAYKAFTREIVEQDRILKTNSYLQTMSTIIKITVPLFSIEIYKYVSIHGVLLLNGISFIFSSVCVVLITPIIDNMKDEKNNSVKIIIEDLRLGFIYVYQNQKIFQLLIFASLVNFFVSGYSLLLPYGNQMYPKIIENVYGAFLASEAAGGLIGAVVSGKINGKLSINRLLFFAGLSGLSLAITPFLYQIFQSIFFVALGPLLYSFFTAIFDIQFFSFIQKNVDNNFLGRVFGIIYAMAVFFSPIGTAFFSVVLNSSFMYNLLFIGAGIVLLSFLSGIILNSTISE